jgi:hypothetical protein
MKNFFILFKYNNARVLHLIRLSFFGIALFIKVVKESISENKGYSFGFTISLLWFQQTLEFTLWDHWRI